MLTAVYQADLRASRAELLGDLLRAPGYIDEAFTESGRWVPAAVHARATSDLALKGVIVYYNLVRKARFPAAWQTLFNLGQRALADAEAFEPSWDSQVGAEIPTAIDRALASLAVMTEIGLTVEDSGYHVSSKVLLDAYLDLFEDSLSTLAKVFIAIKDARNPRRRLPADLEGFSARELYEQLAKGVTWSSALCPFDPFYRNGIAHRNWTILPDGSVTIRDLDNTVERHLSWSHLVALVQDALSVINALLATLELTEVSATRLAPVESVLARERLGFHLLPLGQVVAGYHYEGAGGLLVLDVKGRRCEERDLLAALVGGLDHVDPPPRALFIKYISGHGRPAGHWGINAESLAIAHESIEGIESVVRDTQSNQLRL